MLTSAILVLVALGALVLYLGMKVYEKHTLLKKVASIADTGGPHPVLDNIRHELSRSRY